MKRLGMSWFEPTLCRTLLLILATKAALIKTTKLRKTLVVLTFSLWTGVPDLSVEQLSCLLRTLFSISHHLFRPILLKCGLFYQIRMDRGQEFCLCVFVQELLKGYEFDKRRLPWRQIQSTQNYVVRS